MIWTIPNLISLARIALVPVFLWLLVGRDDPAAAGWLLGGIGATDWIDGYLARKLGQVSALGKMLDPVADRLAVAVAVIAGLATAVIPGWFGATVIAREVVVGAGALVLAFKRKPKLDVRWLGKLSTLMLYFAIPAFMVHAGTGFTAFEVMAWGLGVPGLALYWLVAIQYLGDVRAGLAGGGGAVSSDSPQGERL